MVTFPIDTDIPLPKEKLGAPNKFPWLDMKVGDSFFAVGYSVKPTKTRPVNAKRITTTYARIIIPGSCWQIAETVENGISGVRVWRIK